MVAFAVCFEITDPSPGYGHYSVCAWSGWSDSDEFGDPIVKTHWRLSISNFDRAKDWAATNIGEDAFSKLTDDTNSKLFENLDALKELHAKLTARRGKR
jgi:hypothetical protein